MRVWTLITLFLVSFPVLSDQPDPTFDRVSLSAAALDTVENDILTAQLFAQAEGQDAAALANDVNKRVSWAVEQAKEMEGITVRSLDYQTHPIYRNSRVDGWRVSQAIRLESKDSKTLSTLIGTLQERLSVRSLGYTISPERRMAAEDELIESAVAAFRQRAERVAKAFGKSGYRIVDIRVNTSGSTPRPPYFRQHDVAVAEMAAAAPPALEAGTQDVRVEVSGTVELQ